MSNSVCFIILHYGENHDITFSAIDSVNYLPFQGIVDIVVVCNGKGCDISKEIQQNGYSNVSVIVLKENVGYSKGNNIGYSYAKEKRDYDFLVIMNNDVCIEQEGFLKQLYRIYDRHSFFVAGPDIYIPYKDYHSSPLSISLIEYDEIEDIISKKNNLMREYDKKFSMLGFKTYILEACRWRDKLTGLSKFWRKIKNNNKPFIGEKENVVLQGACLIFSRDYIQINDKAFEPEVFLYFEEHYLARRCIENNWNTLYSDKIQVIHYHRGSSGLLGNSYTKYCEKKKKVLENSLQAAINYKECLNRGE